MNAMVELIVVTGPPGAGKSTVTRLLARMFDPSALVAGDDFFGLIDQGYIAPWTTEAHHQNEVVIGAAAAASGRLVTGGYTVVYDGVIGPWFLEAFGTATALDHLHYAVLLPPEQVCSDRVASRVAHGFTDLDAAHHMYVEFARSDTEDRHIIEDQVSPESIASIIVQRTRDGSLEVPLN